MESINRKYVKVIIKYLWLVILATVVTGAGTYYLRSHQQEYYSSHVRILIGNIIASPDPSIQQINTGAALAVTYTQLITYDVLDTVIKNLDLETTPRELSTAVSPSVVANTPILDIGVTYTDPDGAAEIANEIARVMIAISPSDLTDAQQESMASLRSQMDDVQRQIDVTSRQAQKLYDQLSTMSETDDPTTFERLTADYNHQVDQLNSSHATLAQLSASFLQLASRANQLEIVESARPEPTPIGLRPVIVGAAGAVVGALLSIAGLLYFEYSNTSLREGTEIEELLGLPVLGEIANTNKVRRNKETYLVTAAFPKSRIAEEFRNFRINLLSLPKELLSDPARSVFVVTSAEARVGKSFVSSNLAVSMAAAGMRVLLIDADLRRSSLDEVFGVSNLIGLATLLDLKPSPVFSPPENIIQETSIPGLMVMASGSSTMDSSEMLGSQGLTRYIKSLQSQKKFDVILIDTPPCLVVSDASAVALATDASVVLVVQAGRTHRDAAQKACTQFEQIGVEVGGIVVNRNRKRAPEYGKNRYFRL